MKFRMKKPFPEISTTFSKIKQIMVLFLKVLVKILLEHLAIFKISKYILFAQYQIMQHINRYFLLTNQFIYIIDFI